MKSFVLAFLCLLTGCAGSQFKYGLAWHPEHLDSTDSDMKNPLVILQVDYRIKEYELFSQHSSSAFTNESGYGTNTIGLLRCYNCKPACN